ncbi:MAG: hypothetical protein NTW64_06455 [Candidatus Omnitrophica bacterium]|nr:hypothetical protein [Candidatus Omnitrophota bacterium]
MNKKQFILACVTIFLFPLFCYSQEPELKNVTDSQGNTYMVDETGAVYTEGIPKPGLQPASVENLAYYFNESLMLEINGYLDEAFKIYQEILSLPGVDDSVKTALRLRITRLYEVKDSQELLKKYFDIKELGDGSLEINPRSNPESK